MLGANYWASNAGTEMWRDFNESTIQSDLKILSDNGIEYLRVFPIWRDFQPVKKMFGCNGAFREYTMENEKKPENPYFLSEIMINRFDRFCEICEQYNLKLIVGLITGWMSGRLFIPQALEDKNLFTHPISILLEQKFIKGFVGTFKSKKIIYAWDLGNECNCLSNIECDDDFCDCDVSSSWTNIIVNAIRSEDHERPVISGMANLGPERRKCKWNLQEHGECVDIMTTHPYTLFHPHCSNDYYTSARSLLHATAETRYYSDISKKPCFVEELGTLGNSLCCDNVTADFMRFNLFSNWANNNNGIFWWCSNDQNHLKTPPYTWSMLEVELGLISSNHKPKKYLSEIKYFSNFLKGLDFELPPAKFDAVLIVPSDYEQWDAFGIAFSAYILAKQAKINLKFAYCEDELPDSDTYILPSIGTNYPTLKFYELKEKVQKGATLYLSNSNAFMQGFSDFSGIEIIDSANYIGNVNFEFLNKHFKYKIDKKYITKAITAKVLAHDSNNNPVISANNYGLGTVYFVNAPIEKNKMSEFDAFSDNTFLLYDTLLAKCKQDHILKSVNPNLCITHHYKGNNCYVVIINMSGKTEYISPVIMHGWELKKVYRGSTDRVLPFDASVLLFIKTANY